MRLKSLSKDYKVFVNLVVFASVFIAATTLYFSYRDFTKVSKQAMSSTTNKIDQQITESLYYLENISHFVANQIIKYGNSKKENIASILVNARPKINDNGYDFFTWTLFDFVDANNYVIASSTHGAIANPILVTNEERSWINQAKQKPWKLLSSKVDTGIISREPIIPFGFGISDKGKFLGTISFGINIEKLQRKLELLSSLSYIKFVVFDDKNSALLSSENFNKEQVFEIADAFEKLDKSLLKSGFIEINNQTFYYQPSSLHSFTILTGINKKMFLSELRINFLPHFFNTLYLTIFFLILLFFFRTRLLNPVIQLSNSARQISQGNTNVYVPHAEISEIDLLAESIEQVREFLEKQAQAKIFAEKSNFNKTEFLASTAHELKNIVAGIIGLAEVVKINFSEKAESNDNNFSVPEILENQSFLEDIIKLGEELSEFIRDIIDVNQAQTGDFKIEEHSLVDMKEIVMRSVKLLKIRAIKSQKQIVSHFIKKDDEDFIVNNIDPRRIKQVLVNLISNSIKYADEQTVIEVKLEKLNAGASETLQISILDSVKQNPHINHERKTYLQSIVKKSRPKIMISIKDHGCGMNENEIKIALEKYGRIEMAQSKFIDSTGLGLPLVKHLVEMQGGMMVISSEKNVGTEVKVFL
jgi:signal transduction histidine kinase